MSLSSTTENAPSNHDQLVPLFDPVVESAELIAANRAAELVARAEALVNTGRGGALTRLALGRGLLALGRVDEALAALRKAASLAPSSADIAVAMGDALAAKGALPTAIAEYRRALDLDPSASQAHLQLVALWLEAGEPDRAESELASAEANGADPASIAARRAAVAEHRSLKRSSIGYIRNLFDQFAADYDDRMRSRLGYSAPETLRDLCSLLLGPAEKTLDVLDLGCGTGLSGVAFAGISRRLVGVDLSSGMLTKAATLSLYEKLLVADIEDLPADLTGFDLVVAADVLVYVGDLSKVFAQVRNALKPQGLWAFTSERMGTGDFELGPKRRYRHSEAYVRSLAQSYGFEVASLVECVTRYDAGMAVPSLAAVLRLA
ncbi:MAG: methyltransferase domain-containing protein [Alphaproteobacteria bacterium]|nr:methyltransferase domain-containing protein [Alphaproteobacteria bacterium]